MFNFIPVPTHDEKTCFDMGYDCHVNGANTTNCNFSLFSTRENTAAWEAGKRQAAIDHPQPPARDQGEAG